MKSVAELKPPPVSGEWLSVFPNKNGKTRIIVQVDEKCNNLVRLPHAGVTGIANVFDPMRKTPEEAQKELKEEILGLASMEISASDKEISKIFLRDMRSFYKRKFGEDA